MSLLQRICIGMWFIFAMSIFAVYSSDYFPHAEGSYWKFDWQDLYQHGGGKVDIRGTATWTISKIQNGKITIDRKINSP